GLDGSARAGHANDSSRHALHSLSLRASPGGESAHELRGGTHRQDSRVQVLRGAHRQGGLIADDGAGTRDGESHARERSSDVSVSGGSSARGAKRRTLMPNWRTTPWP